jgi:CBS-domain-containing membrane protein
MQVRDAMTTNVIGIQSEASLAQAIEIMLRSHISALPVFDEERTLVGILSEGDLLRRAELGTEKRRPRWLEFLIGPGSFANAYVHSHGRKVDEVMTTNVVTIELTAALAEAVDLMNRHNIKRLPVMQSGFVVGILARADLLRAMAPLLRTPPKISTDAKIRDSILDQFKQLEWTPIASIAVDVHQGVVELRGSLSDERQRSAIKVIVENIPGVTVIRDHLIWVEPNSGVYLLSEEDARAERASV